MPPVGSRVLDDRSRELVAQWILGMPDAAFASVEVGEGPLTGSLTQRGSVRAISGIGHGMQQTDGDRLHFAGDTIGRYGQIVARLDSIAGSRPGMNAGIMLRESSASNAPAVWLAQNAAGFNSVTVRYGPGELPSVAAVSPRSQMPMLRLLRSGKSVAALESADGAAWHKVADVDFLVDSEAVAGLAISSGEDWRHATAEFDDIQVASAKLHVTDSAPSDSLPKDLILTANVDANGVVISQVDFYADGQFLSSRSTPPWRFPWTNAWAGTHELIAVCTDSSGLSITSEPVHITLRADPPIASFAGFSNIDAAWLERHADLGYLLPAVATNIPSPASISVQPGEVKDHGRAGALSAPGGSLPATSWGSPNELLIPYRPGNEVAHRVTLFFARYEATQSVEVTIRGANSGAVLDQRTIAILEPGVFASWVTRGAIDIRIKEVTELPAILNGVFWAALPKPLVQLHPVPGPVVLPASILLRADASVEGRAIRRVEFWDGEVKIGEDAGQPFELQWLNPHVGPHLISAVAYDEFGLTARSEPVVIECVMPPAGATFIGEDRLTQGDWSSAYGALGQFVVAGWTNLSPNLGVSADGFIHTFTSWDFTAPSLRYPNSEGRLAACYFAHASTDIELRVSTRDARPVRMGLYFLDWPGEGRAQQIVLQDVATGRNIDIRSIESFADGAYLVWNIRGEVRILIRSLNDFNAVVSGVFFDSPAPEISITRTPPDQPVTLPGAITLRAHSLSPSKPLQHVEFYSNLQRIGSATNEPFEFVWTNALAGEHSVFARGINAARGNADSTPITMAFELPQASARFVTQKGGIAGNWWKAFGEDGFAIPGGSETLRDFTRIAVPASANLHEWSPSTSDERGVFVPDTDAHAAVSWSSVESFDVAVELADGLDHLVAFYFLDFNRAGAIQTVRVLDARSGEIIDEHLLDDIGEGVYLSWNARGRLRFQIVPQSDLPALTSGIFFGGPIPTSQFWWARYFGGDLLAVPRWEEDPDHDGRPNLEEYRMGSDPFTADPPIRMTTSVDGVSLMIELNIRQDAPDAHVEVQSSTDLLTWQPALATRDDGENFIRFSVPLVEPGQNFFRVRVSEP